MPASGMDIYYMQDVRNNFGAMRPAPVCTDANPLMGQCHNNIHVSTSCYYGYQPSKNANSNQQSHDCEMTDVSVKVGQDGVRACSRKRNADDDDYPQMKRLREEDMVPAPSNYNPCLLRPTHNNPDISRCLMGHMI